MEQELTELFSGTFGGSPIDRLCRSVLEREEAAVRLEHVLENQMMLENRIAALRAELDDGRATEQKLVEEGQELRQRHEEQLRTSAQRVADIDRKVQLVKRAAELAGSGKKSARQGPATGGGASAQDTFAKLFW